MRVNQDVSKVNRIIYADSKVYVNDAPLKGVSSCEINMTREVEGLRSLLHYEITDHILKSDQKPEVTISWILGDESNDPFFDFQTEAFQGLRNPGYIEFPVVK